MPRRQTKQLVMKKIKNMNEGRPKYPLYQEVN